MAEQINVPSDLWQKVTQLHDVANTVKDINDRLGKVNTINKEIAGYQDDMANTYTQQVDQPMKALTSAVTAVQGLLHQAGWNGQDTAKNFTNADNNNTNLVNGM